MLRVVWKATVFVAVTGTLIPVQWLAIRLRLPLARALPVTYHRLLCRLLGIRITVTGERCREVPLLIASNHVSYLDIPVITTLAPVVFVAKREVASWPLFGLLARLQRTVFVDRERRHRTADTTREMAARLADGDPVVVFAEGTSSDGSRVRPFRSSLIGAVESLIREGGGDQTGGGRGGAAQVFVQPLAIAYTTIDGLPIGRAERPRIAWYGGMDLLPHLAAVMRLGSLDVTVAWGPPIACSDGTSRKQLAAELETAVRGLLTGALRQR